VKIKLASVEFSGLSFIPAKVYEGNKCWEVFCGTDLLQFPAAIYFCSPIFLILNLYTAMGKGDRKTRKGKLWRGTYGILRRNRKRKYSPPAEEPAEPVKTQKGQAG
jgi:ribosomal small subunit protein bTHX